MQYIEISARVAAPDAELVCVALRDALGVTAWVEHAFTQRSLEEDATLDTGAPVMVRAYVAATASGDAVALAQAALTAAGAGCEVASVRVDEEDWAESWKEHFQVERYGEGIVVVPSWRAYEARADDVVIALDPGMAFGTGQHETTRMCLEALERSVTAGARVLDVGCGSGILSIAAAKLGAREVLAVDIDPECARITRENARRNACDAVDARAGSAGGAWPFAAPMAGFDIVVANIVAAAIVPMAHELAGSLAPGGRLIVSGIIGDREGETIAAIECAGVAVAESRAMGDWRCIEALRR